MDSEEDYEKTMNLEIENEILRIKLKHAQAWMEHQVREAQKNIEKQKSSEQRQNLFHTQREELIENQIYNFFPPEVLVQFPEHGIENILSSEVIYYSLIQGYNIDGTGVILGYQKILDAMIEMYITKSFRKFVQKNNLSRSPENAPLEKSLHSVIEKNYILSLGRLYQILSDIKKQKRMKHYELCFKNFLQTKKYLETALLETDFFQLLEELIQMQAISEKRHF